MKYIIGLLLALSFMVIGCSFKDHCNPSTSVDIHHAKCYQYGNLILDTDVVCANSSTFWYYFYEEKSRSVISVDRDNIQCFILRKTK